MKKEPEAMYTFLGDKETFLTEGWHQQALFVVDYGDKGGLIAFKVIDLYNAAKQALGKSFDMLAEEVPQEVIDTLGEDEE